MTDGFVSRIAFNSCDTREHAETNGPLSNLIVDTETLIWLDSCDVQTARAAVSLAKRSGATIHVGQSTASHAVKSVMSNAGWFGTTLSEVAARAQLIVTLGDGVLSESPLLAERFFRSRDETSQARWLHISSHEPRVSTSSISNTLTAAPDGWLRWPREDWFEQLSRLACDIQPSASTQLSSQRTNSQEADSLRVDSTRGKVGTEQELCCVDYFELVDQLKAADQVVWIWDIDDLHFGTDELVVRRMLSIANTLNEAGRCALLPLDMNIGRVTAEETLLWLTGCPGTACWQGDRWDRVSRYAGYSLEQWADAFPKILLISNLASDRSLPNLPATVTLQAKPALRSGDIQVAAVGIECSGHLFRGDRGTVHFCEATQSSARPSALQLLNSLAVTNRSAPKAEASDAH